MVSAGYAVGKRLIEANGITAGDKVLTTAEFPEAAYATLRNSGVKRAMDEVGAEVEMIGVGVDNTKVLTAISQYLLGNPQT